MKSQFNYLELSPGEERTLNACQCNGVKQDDTGRVTFRGGSVSVHSEKTCR